MNNFIRRSLRKNELGGINMFATLFLLLFMILIPKKFKKVGVKMIIENHKQGLFLFILSKFMWWFLFLQITKIWISDYMIFAYVFAVIGVAYQFYREKKYLSFVFKKKQTL